ncbi:hypothetical protein ECA2858 [Pectobacterium atrosepticum SCRI1043]|uniref:Uncharacterized protein n=1 Tax=Pectobacterium atrosepticum (strain SCRI 1043 / ATCC BAA-672) TaxID=218491 RepID=Q6D386_PECAS|nr:hypothetical protein ECA2858 [Pectobacterium atrosepticum SCRI1043]
MRLEGNDVVVTALGGAGNRTGMRGIQQRSLILGLVHFGYGHRPVTGRIVVLPDLQRKIICERC